MEFFIPKNIDFVLRTLIDNGFEAYIVGGCVRDILLGTIPHDFDITTSAEPTEIKSVFKKTVDTGIKHGTVTVFSDGEPIEVTTFRTESGYNDSRHPDSVTFVRSLSEDLKRRDFTVNAMAYNKTVGLVDIFSGVDDIKTKTLRAVGEPTQRFREDALRILRLFRFSSTLGFDIDSYTLKGAIECSEGLKSVSAERIANELIRAVNGKNVAALYPILRCGGLDFLGLSNSDLGDISALPSGNIRIFAFLIRCAESIKATADILKLSNGIKDYLTDMEKIESSKFPTTRAEIKTLLMHFEGVFDDFLIYSEIINRKDTEDIKKQYLEIIKNKEPYKISHLEINGNDLTALGITGTDVGKTLNRLLLSVINEPSLNKREILLTKIRT